ncbi:glycosyltransferase [Microbacterium abyssi]|uniref:glycosyltransferase n=1 Tax=Microbacterium abyssi TaxID=2782166 RepID=UPI0018891C46|nr:glycosyltransferase [Microbacterium sp. A18JL241]
MTSVLPSGEYLVLASRLIPDLDGGFTISVLRRARDMAAAGARVRILTVDPGTAEEHDAHRAEWRRRGLLPDGVELRNLFDDARADAAWLRAAARPLDDAADSAGDRRIITDSDGRTVLELPVIHGDPNWHLSEASVVVWDAAGPVGRLAGFGALYRTWINALAAETEGVIVICEARQVGELLVADAAPLLAPGVVLLHATHACHVLAPFHWDSPIDAIWERWLGIADRFDQVLWLTPSQRADVERRIGSGIRSAVVPHSVPVEGQNLPVPGRLSMMCSLIPRKRVDHAIRALARVRADVPDAELHVYGAGALRHDLEQLAAELGVDDAVELHGHLADLSEAWREADAFVFTSTNEGQGMVVLEALGHGVPLISYDMPYGPKDALVDGGGILVDDGDVEALASAMTAVIGDRRRRDELASQARTAAARRSPAASMAALGAAVRDAIAAPAARPGR